MDLIKLVKERKGTIVDVRTQDEYRAGHVDGAVNFPLQEITQHLQELKTLQPPLVVCCASGIRSGKAYGYLQQQGLECINAGSWLDIKSYYDQHVGVTSA